MYEAISDASNGNISTLGVAYGKGAIRTMLVRVIFKFLCECPKVCFQMKDELIEFRRALLSAYKSLPTMPESE